MANSDKNILITPNRGLSGKPEIALTGAGNSTMYVRVPDETTATLNFESGTGSKVFALDNKNSSGDLLNINDNTGLSYLTASHSGNCKISEVNTTTVNGSGLILPRFEKSQLPIGEEGQLVYDKTDKCVKLFDGQTWQPGCLEVQQTLTPSKGKLTIDQFGNVVYTPNSNWHGADKFNLRIITTTTRFNDVSNYYITIPTTIVQDPPNNFESKTVNVSGGSLGLTSILMLLGLIN
jgi:hypothetical protein